MSSAGSVGGDAKLRLFCALRLPDDVLDGVVSWQQNLEGSGRLVPRQNLHLTLAFLGWQPVERVEEIVETLRAAAAQTAPIEFEVSGYRETRAVGMLVFTRDEAAERLALELQQALLGAVERETWLPHASVVRFRTRPRLRPALPDLGRFAPSDAAAYISRLHPKGAQYDVLEHAALGGE